MDATVPVEVPTAVGRRVGSALTWSFLAFSASKVAGLALTVALGFLLSKRDMGVWQATLGVYALMVSIRDGGVNQLLIQRGEANYRSLIGRVFWFACAFHAAAGLVLLAAAPLVVRANPDKPELFVTVSVCGLALMVAGPASTGMTRLRMQMRFRAATAIQLASSLVRVGVIVGAAAAGLGALSFAIGLVAVAVFESLVTLMLAKEPMWKNRPEVSRWPALIRDGRWLIALGVGSAIFQAGDSLVLTALSSLEMMGVYFLAFTLVFQIDQAISGTASQVLFPAFSRLRSDGPRLADALRRSLRGISLASSPLTLCLALVAEPLLHLIWKDRWAESIVPLQLFCIFSTGRSFLVATCAALLALDRTRAAFISTLGAGLVVLIATVIGAVAFGTATGTALCVGIATGPVCLLIAALQSRVCGLSVRQMLRSACVPWVLAVFVAVPIFVADTFLKTNYLGWNELGFTGPAPARHVSFARCAVLSFLFFAMYAAAIRIFLHEGLHDALRIAPGPVSRFAERFFRLTRSPVIPKP